MVYRHISIFKLKAPVAAENLARFASYLEEAAASCELVVASEVGVASSVTDRADGRGAEGRAGDAGAPRGAGAERTEGAAPMSPEGAPEFGNIVQIVDFATRADADAYPTHRAHQELFAKTEPFVDRVFAIDYPLGD